MSAVENVFHLNREFLEEMSKPSSKNDRDSLILKINEFLAKREILLKDMKGPYTAEEKQLGLQMIEDEQKIHALLYSLKSEIQQDFSSAKNIKKNAPKYINPYSNMFTEGAYYDKRN